MNQLLYNIKKHGFRSVLVLLFAAVLLTVFLFTPDLAFRAPRQEYENNDVKNSRIIFSKPSGFYRDPFTLKIKAPTSEIYYTLDGTDPVRGQEGTFQYTREGVEITDATDNDNVHSMRTDVTTGFDLKAVEELSKNRRPMNYQVPDYKVDKCTILRAAFYNDDGERSEIQTGAWFIGFEGREGYGGIRTVSIVTDPANLFDYEKGIYVTGKAFDDFVKADGFNDSHKWYRHYWWWWDANYRNGGRDWERQANVQFFDKDGQLLLQQEAGIRIQGGGSRGFYPKSLNLYARKDYDGNSRFHYDFFDTGFEAKRLTLTTGGDDVYTKQKDRLVSELTADQDFAIMHYVPVFLFLDGEFWGVYHLTEKYDEKYFSYYYDVPEEEVLEIKNNSIEVGTKEDLALYEEMKSFIEESDMSVEENYEKACGLMDMDSFINYFAVLTYCARCGDWPSGNFALWRTRPPADPEAQETQKTQEIQEKKEAAPAPAASGGGSPYRDGRWRWVLFDVNSAAISSELKQNQHDTLQYVIKTSKMFESLSKNPGFREQFSRQILEYGRTVFSPESVNEKTDEYEAELTEPMKLHLKRFFGEDSGLDFDQITETEIRDFFTDRYSIVEKILEENFQDDSEE